jgi:hypothetical protein
MKNKLVLFFIIGFSIFISAASGYALTWQNVTPSWSADNQTVSTMAVFNGRLFAATGDLYGTQMWSYDGTAWSNVTPSWWSGWSGSVRSMAVFDGLLYVVTDPYDAGTGTETQIWSYDGTTWSNRHLFIYGYNEQVYCMATFLNLIFFGTSEYTTSCTGSHTGQVRAYDGLLNWSEYSPWGLCANVGVSSMAVFNGQLYVAATKNYTYGPDIWSYDGRTWSNVQVPSPWLWYYLSVSNMGVFNGRLYAGTSDAQVWAYDGTTWSNTNFPKGSNIVGVSGMTVFNGNLFIGTTTQGTGTSLIAEVWSYDGTIWSKDDVPWGSGYYSTSFFSVFNSRLYVGISGFGPTQIWSLGSPTVPGAPTQVTAVAGNAQATVSFTPPDSNGGSPITSYTVTSNPDNITAVGTSSPITLIGLTNGTPYTFTVTATNAVGTSPASLPSNMVTPAAPTETISIPSMLSGPASGSTDTYYSYSTGGSMSNLGHSVQYLFEWGDGNNSGWLPIGTVSASHSWSFPGSYAVRAKARCATDTSVVSNWSGTLTINISPDISTLTVSRIGTGDGTIRSSDGNIDCGSKCSHVYNAGVVVSLTATPSSGSTFSGWSGACSGTGDCVINVNSDQSVTASFSQQTNIINLILRQMERNLMLLLL